MGTGMRLAVALMFVIGFSGSVFAQTSQDAAAERPAGEPPYEQENKKKLSQKLDFLEGDLAAVKVEISGLTEKSELEKRIALLSAHMTQLISENKYLQDKLEMASRVKTAFKDSLKILSERQRTLEAAKRDAEVLLSLRNEEFIRLKEDYAVVSNELALLRKQITRTTHIQDDLMADADMEKKADFIEYQEGAQGRDGTIDRLNDKIATLTSREKKLADSKQNLETLLSSREDEFNKLKEVLRRIYKSTQVAENKNYSNSPILVQPNGG